MRYRHCMAFMFFSFSSISSPLEHFNIDILGYFTLLKINITSDLFFYLSSSLVLMYIWFFVEFRLDSTKIQILNVIEFSYKFILEIFKNQTSSIRIIRFFPLFYVLF